MTSTSFRDSMNSLGWARRAEADLPASTNSSKPLLSRLSDYNPFGQGGYVQLPTQESSGAPLPARNPQEEREAYFALGRWDRLLVFGACNLGAVVCFIICFFLFPFLLVKPRKFAILWSVGSLLFLTSWAVLMGPYQYATHLLSGPRLPFTATYFGSIIMTIYFAVGLQSLLLTLISSIIQLVALVWYAVSYFPMGSTGMRFAARLGTSRVTAWMSE